MMLPSIEFHYFLYEYQVRQNPSIPEIQDQYLLSTLDG